MKRTILQERETLKMKRVELYSHKEIRTHTKTIKYMIVHIAYTLLFIWIVLMQLKLDQRYSQTNLKMNLENQSFIFQGGDSILCRRSLINKLLFSFSDVDQIDLIDNWTKEILFDSLYENSKNIFFNQNYIISNPLMLLIVRRIKNHTNSCPYTQEAFNFYISSSSYKTDSMLEDEAETEKIVLDNRETITYISENCKNAVNNLGGYYISYSKDKETALSYDYIKDSQLMKPGWTNAIFIFAYVNRNNQMMVINQISFDQYATGEIIGKYIADSFPEYYSSSLDYFRAVLEIIFLVFT